MPRQFKQITLGDARRQLKVEGISISEVTYAPHIEIPPHSHRNANVSLILEGEFEERVDGKTIKVEQSHLVFKPRGTVHSNRYGPRGARSLVVEFLDDGPDQSAWGPVENAGCQWVTASPSVAPAIRLYRDFISQESQSRRRIKILDDIAEILALARLDRNPVEGQSRAARNARDLVRKNFAMPVGICEIAKEIGVHSVYLARAFRRVYGCTLTEYRRRLRISEAAKRLLNTNEPLTAIAHSAGFADQSHLSRNFKATFGIPPGEFRSGR